MRMWIPGRVWGSKLTLPECSRAVCVCVNRSVMSYSDDNMDYSCQAPLSMEFSRQEYWSGLPFSSSGDLPHLGIEPRSPTLQAESLPSETAGKPL